MPASGMMVSESNSALERYTNYGMLDGLGGINLTTLRLDTWYFEALTTVGSMRLGAAHTQVASGVGDFLSQQLGIFAEAFEGVLQVRPGLFGTYKKALPSVRAFTFNFEGSQAGLSTWLTDRVPLPAYVDSLQPRLDVRAAIRDMDGSLVDRWLTNIAHVTFLAELERGAHKATTDDARCPWVALLDIDVISLFQRDNSALLARGRERWKQLREQDPTIRWDDSDDGITIVTLEAPPPGTPKDNRELYEVNGPRLLSAMKKWERRTGATFQWKVDLEA